MSGDGDSDDDCVMVGVVTPAEREASARAAAIDLQPLAPGVVALVKHEAADADVQPRIGRAARLTKLRRRATDSSAPDVWVAPAHCVKENERVTIVRVEGEWAWVRTAAAVEGYLKACFLLREGGAPAAPAA
eukprot:COSAG04_NODE_5139_length_1723_cov_1.520320_2_plen_131_part_01